MDKFEDDPRAESWDNVGRYYPKTKEHSYSKASVLDQVIDYESSQGLDGGYNYYKIRKEYNSQRAKEYYQKNKEKILLKAKLKKLKENAK